MAGRSTRKSTASSASFMQALLWNPEDIQKAVMARAKGKTPVFDDLEKQREGLKS